MEELVNCFYAHPLVMSSETSIANLPEIVETINEAVARINRLDIVRVQTLQSIAGGIPPSFSRVARAIDASDLFICDLSILDIGILFQVGYALTKKKKIWVSINSTVPGAMANYRKFAFLQDVMPAEYRNSYDLESKFFEDCPYESLDSTLYADVIQSIVSSSGKPPQLLYIKSDVRTESSIQLSRRLDSISPALTIDDPDEVANQPLAWYAQNSYYAYGVVVHLMDTPRSQNMRSFRNERAIFVAGLAYGFDKPILLLAHAPFEIQLELGDLLASHTVAAECVHQAGLWLPSIESNIREQTARYTQHERDLRGMVGLHRIQLGEYIAENEVGNLADYFVTTAAYTQAMNTSQYMIFLGRKGSGKTANLYQIRHEVASRRRNHVCLITPTDYEFDGVMELFNTALSQADKGFLVESLWKFLVYTELAISIVGEVASRPVHSIPTEAEQALQNYIRTHPILQSDFAVRLEYALRGLCRLDTTDSKLDQRSKVSEILHTEMLGSLRRILRSTLAEKDKIYVLLDNLDKGWKNREDLDVLSSFLHGLLNAAHAISSEFQKQDQNRHGVDFALIIFLRSDIFGHIASATRETDKLAISQIDWNDAELLKRVIEERFRNSVDESFPENEVWERFFSPSVRGIPTPQFILESIIPRPRDIIFFCRSALSHAINRKHSKIDEDDILQAEKEYSEFVFFALKTEVEAEFARIEDFLLELVGLERVITRQRLNEAFAEVGVPNEDVGKFIDLLCDYTFLGIEVAPSDFVYLYEANRKRINKQRAKVLATQQYVQRFAINRPFTSYLGIQEQPVLQLALLGNEHTNIASLFDRLDMLLKKGDYAGVIHTSATILETMAKEVMGNPNVNNQSLGSFFQAFRKKSNLPDKILDNIEDIYQARNTTPLAGHGSLTLPTITIEEATTVAEMTKAFVRIEYLLKEQRSSK